VCHTGGDALKNVNYKLTKLDLGYNSIADQGVSHLCDALKNVNYKLTKLNLVLNGNITDRGKRELHESNAERNAPCQLYL